MVGFRSALFGYFDRELFFHIVDAQLFLMVSLKLVFWGGNPRGGGSPGGVPIPIPVPVPVPIR